MDVKNFSAVTEWLKHKAINKMHPTIVTYQVYVVDRANLIRYSLNFNTKILQNDTFKVIQ